MKQIYTQTHIPGAVLSRKVDNTGTAVVTLYATMDEGSDNSWGVSIQMDGTVWNNRFGTKCAAEECYTEQVHYFQLQADYFREQSCTTI